MRDAEIGAGFDLPGTVVFADVRIGVVAFLGAPAQNPLARLGRFEDRLARVLVTLPLLRAQHVQQFQIPGQRVEPVRLGLDVVP
jgi:hypothetical protein